MDIITTIQRETFEGENQQIFVTLQPPTKVFFTKFQAYHTHYAWDQFNVMCNTLFLPIHKNFLSQKFPAIRYNYRFLCQQYLLINRFKLSKCFFFLQPYFYPLKWVLPTLKPWRAGRKMCLSSLLICHRLNHLLIQKECPHSNQRSLLTCKLQ